jgi:hypothetical protein
LDFGQKRLVGTLVITTPFSGVVELGSGLVVGDLTASGINATFNNNLTVTGSITIQAVSMNTWNQLGDAQQVIVTADGGRINFVSGTVSQGLVISGLAKTNPIVIGGSITALPIVIDAESVIELLNAANNVTITKDIALTLNASTTLNITAGGAITTLNAPANIGVSFATGSITLENLSSLLPVMNLQTLQRFNGIQGAIDNAQVNETLMVEEGIYDEQITMNVSGLVLRAASGATPTIRYSSINNLPVVSVIQSGVLEGFIIDAVTSGVDSIAIEVVGTQKTTFSGLILKNAYYGIQGDNENKPQDLSIVYSTFETAYGISNTSGMIRLFIKDNNFLTSLVGIELEEFVTIAQEDAFSNGLRRLAPIDWKQWLEENNDGLSTSSGVIDNRTSTNRVFEGSTIIQDVSFTSGTSFANFNLTYTLDDSGFITGNALTSLAGQNPGPGGFPGYGYGSVGIERPSTDVTHSSVVGYYQTSSYNADISQVSSFGGVTGKYWYVYLAIEVNPDTLQYQLGTGKWRPFRNRDTYFFTVTWFTTNEGQQVFHSREHILVTVNVPQN